MSNKVVSFFERLGKGGLKAAQLTAPAFGPLGIEAETVLTALASHFHQPTEESNPMNALEQFAITMVLGIIQQTVKNPSHKAALENQLVGIATLIFAEYGMVPPIVAPVSH